MKVGAILLGATLATTLACSGAKAGLIDLNGYIGPVQFKFQNYESFTGNTITPGAMDFGVVKVTSIVNPVTGTNLWVQGQGGQFLAAVFNGITVNTPRRRAASSRRIPAARSNYGWIAPISIQLRARPAT